MSELAFNVNGEAFEVPPAATGWRVRRLKQKGAPEVVYGRDGLPLVLTMDAGMDELRDEVGAPGRYRLDPVDELGKPVPNTSTGYVFVHAEQRAAAATTTTTTMGPASDSIVMEAMRMNAQIACSVVDRFPLMLEAAATLLRAADGAGLPARTPIAKDEAEEDDEEEVDEEDVEASAGFDLNALVAQLVPVLMAGLMSGKTKLPGLAALFDWRKAAPKPAEPSRGANACPRAPNEPSEPTAAEVSLPPLDPTTMAHFLAIQQTLTPQESQLARELAADLSPTELRAWFDELSKLGVPEAAEKIRTLIGGAAKHGGAAA